MQIIDNGKFIKATADKGYKIFSPKTNSYHSFIIVGKMEYLNNYKEVKDPNLTYEEEQVINSIIDDAFSELATLANNLINNI